MARSVSPDLPFSFVPSSLPLIVPLCPPLGLKRKEQNYRLISKLIKVFVYIDIKLLPIF